MYCNKAAEPAALESREQGLRRAEHPAAWEHGMGWDAQESHLWKFCTREQLCQSGSAQSCALGVKIPR